MIIDNPVLLIDLVKERWNENILLTFMTSRYIVNDKDAGDEEPFSGLVITPNRIISFCGSTLIDFLDWIDLEKFTITCESIRCSIHGLESIDDCDECISKDLSKVNEVYAEMVLSAGKVLVLDCEEHSINSYVSPHLYKSSKKVLFDFKSLFLNILEDMYIPYSGKDVTGNIQNNIVSFQTESKKNEKSPVTKTALAPSEEAPPPDEKACSSCCTMVAWDAVMCYACGTQLGDVPAEEKPVMGGYGEIACPSCGTMISGDDVMCYACGTQIE